MTASKKSTRVIEFGDFQTPTHLARDVCKLLADRGIEPAAVLEPTCGEGNLLVAALDRFPSVDKALGFEINEVYLRNLETRLRKRPDSDRVRVIQSNFFHEDWPARLAELSDPLLVIGNPPWVTNAELGGMGGSNLPKKTNFQNHAGLDALTGKSNFDISEWMLLEIVRWLDGRRATLAMLSKTAVARKVLMHAWKMDIALDRSEIYPIDAKAAFNASVDACLLICDFVPLRKGAPRVRLSVPDDAHPSSEPVPFSERHFAPEQNRPECAVHSRFELSAPSIRIGYRDGQLVADIDAYQCWKHLQGGNTYRWRSGIKHDCAKVMELRREGECFRNGLQEVVELEEDCIFPMLKGSEVSKGGSNPPSRWMLVPQKRVGEDTTILEHEYPKTWQYLQSHADRLAKRGSSIYRNRPPFSVFGVGDYSFAPWKVAICGLYKKIEFTLVGSVQGKPVVFDDTCYLLPCPTEKDARNLIHLLNSAEAKSFYSAFVFWDAKRPITAELLKKLDLDALAKTLDRECPRFDGHNPVGHCQKTLFESY